MKSQLYCKYHSVQHVLVFLNGYSSSYWPSVIFGGGDHSVVGGECFSSELCCVDLKHTKHDNADDTATKLQM